MRGYSSAGRAPALQAGGQRFDPAYLHQTAAAVKVEAVSGLNRKTNERKLKTGT